MTTWTTGLKLAWAVGSPGIRPRPPDDLPGGVLPSPRTRTRLQDAMGEELDAVLSNVATGDRAAFSKLYDRVVPVVLGLAVRVVRDRTIAEEVTQEVMVEVWRTATRYDPSQGSALAWVGTIAHRRAVDRVRSEQAARRRAEKVAAEGGLTPFDSVSESVIEGQERARVRAGLDSLSRSQRQAIELAYFGSMTYREVAENLGLPLGTVKTRIRDGLLKLAENLGVGS